MAALAGRVTWAATTRVQLNERSSVQMQKGVWTSKGQAFILGWLPFLGALNGDAFHSSSGFQSSSPKCLQGPGGCVCDRLASGSSTPKC